MHPENVRRRTGHHGGQLDGVWPRVPVHGAVRHQGPDDDLQRAVGPIIINDLEGNRTSFAFETTSHNSGVIDEFVDALAYDREPEVSGREALTTM